MTRTRYLRRVLVGIDFSEHSEAAARAACAIAARRGADVMLAHCHPAYAFAGSSLLPQAIADELDATAIDEARRELEVLRTTLCAMAPAPAAVRTEVACDRPADALLSLAHEWDASLLVLGSRGKSQVGSWLLGSVSRELSSSAPCPVLVVRAGVTTGSDGRFARATVGVDHSQSSRPLVDVTRGLLDDSAHIELVHTISVPGFLAASESDDSVATGARALGASALAWAGSRMAQLRDAAGLGADVASATVELGRAAPALLEHAERTGSDLIAVGSHSRASLVERALGTTADRVLQRASVPVLVLPSTALDDARIAPGGEMAIFEQLRSGANRTYLVAAHDRKAMLVDPDLDQVETYLAMIAARGLELVYVVDTHTRADRASGGPALSERIGASYIVHESSPTAAPAQRVVEGQKLAIGELTAKVLYTPGQTADGLTLVFPDRVLIGDLLLGAEARGPGLDPGRLWDSLHKLDGLGGDTLTFAAHASANSRAFSTLGGERLDNPLLAPRTRAAFIEWSREATAEQPLGAQGDVA